MMNQEWDVIIGSIHMMGDHFVGDSLIRNSDDLCKLNDDYFSMVLDMVKAGGFDIMGHLDFPKRYFGKGTIPGDLIDEILLQLPKKNIALEINTSPLRKGLDECSPSREIVEKYAAAGGKMITLGSDAHTPEDVAADLTSAVELCRSLKGLEIGYFEKRNFIPVN